MIDNAVRKARMISDISAEQAGKIVGLSTNVYYQKERKPQKFTLAQLKALASKCNDLGKQILMDELISFFNV